MSDIKGSLGLENVGTVFRNSSIDFLIDFAVKMKVLKYLQQVLLMIDTGIFTGRSPKDKFLLIKTLLISISRGEI